MTKLSCAVKAWDDARPSSVKKTGVGEAIGKVLKLVPGGEAAKIATVDDCNKARTGIQSLLEVMGTAQTNCAKAKDDKKDAAKLLGKWIKEAEAVLDEAADRQTALFEGVTDAVIKKWSAPRKDLEKKVQEVVDAVKHADNNIGHSEQLREECLMAMAQRAGTLRETGHVGKLPTDFLDDHEFKASYELWEDQIVVAVKASKVLEDASSKANGLKKLIAMMETEVQGAAETIGSAINLDSSGLKAFKAFKTDVHAFWGETCSNNAATYAVFAFIPSFEPSSEIRRIEDGRLERRFAKVGKIDAESYFESKLANYGLNETRLKKALQSVMVASRQVAAQSKTLREAREEGGDNPGALKVLQSLAASLDEINKKYIKARANQEMAQALSRPENKDMADQITKALMFFKKSSEDADEALKEFA